MKEAGHPSCPRGVDPGMGHQIRTSAPLLQDWGAAIACEIGTATHIVCNSDEVDLQKHAHTMAAGWKGTDPPSTGGMPPPHSPGSTTGGLIVSQISTAVGTVRSSSVHDSSALAWTASMWRLAPLHVLQPKKVATGADPRDGNRLQVGLSLIHI